MAGTPIWTRRPNGLVVLGVVFALLVGSAVLLAAYLVEPFSCARPPSQQERAAQEAFVRAHLPDARDFEWTVLDCDDQGQAYLDFATRSSGPAASKAFLDDPVCKASVEPDASPDDASCTSGGVEITISIEDDGGIDTYGELSPVLR